MYRLRALMGCIDMGYKRTGRPCHDSEHYADGKSLKTLARYLCSMAKHLLKFLKSNCPIWDLIIQIV